MLLAPALKVSDGESGSGSGSGSGEVKGGARALA